MGRLPRPAVGRSGLLFLACFAGLVLWQGLSIVWSVQPDRSWDYVNRGLVYLAFLCIGMFIAALVPRAPRAVAAGLAALLGLVLAYALLAKGIPALYSDYGRLARLRSPIGDWNALSLLGDLALVLGLWRGARRQVDGVVLVFVATIATLLAYSRGGVLIGVLVAAAWLALASKRFEALVTLALGGGAGVGVAGVSLLLHGVTHNHQSHASRAHDGVLFLLVVIVLGVVAAALARRAFRLEPTPAAQQRATFALLVLLVLGAVGGIVGVALESGRSTNANAAGSYCVQSASRFACGSSDERLDWWKEAWQSFRDQPLRGTGAGSFQLAHMLRRTHYTRPVPEPHNLVLQVLGETGIVGFVLFVGAVVAAVLAIRPRIREDDAVAALAICVVAYLLHSLIDMDYDFVAVSAPLFVVLGVLLARPGPVVARREPIWALGIAAFAATAILSLAAPYIAVQKTNEALRATSLPRALDLLHQAHAWNPVSVDPLLTQAALEPNKLRALQLYHMAVDTQPDNPEPLIQLGVYELHLKDACSAWRDLNHAYTLDRFNPGIAQPGGPLDVARAKVNKGACRT
jgi:O-antigen ligase